MQTIWQYVQETLWVISKDRLVFLPNKKDQGLKENRL